MFQVTFLLDVVFLHEKGSGAAWLVEPLEGNSGLQKRCPPLHLPALSAQLTVLTREQTYFIVVELQSRKVQSMVLSLAQLARLDLLRYWNETMALQVRCVSLAFAAIWNSLDIPAPCDCSSAVKPQVSAVCPSAITWASGATPYAEDKAERLMVTTGHFLEYMIALIRQ